MARSRIDRGLYRLFSKPGNELRSFAEVSERVPHPNCPRAQLSALQVHGLTADAPHAGWLLIDRHSRLPRLATPRLELVLDSGAACEHGVEVRRIEGVNVQLTTPA